MPLTIRSDLGFCFDRRFEIVFALTSQFKSRRAGSGLEEGELWASTTESPSAPRSSGSRGRAAGRSADIGIDAEPGSLIAVEGPSGSGRTCLLLALTGRMKPTEGQAAVGSFRLPKQMSAVRRISAPAHVPGVTDLDPALTVGEHLLERALLQRRFGGSAAGAAAAPRGAGDRGEAADRHRAGRRRARPGDAAQGFPDRRYATWSAWRRCGCPSRWPSSAVRVCSPSTTSTSSSRTPNGPRPGRC